MAMGETDLTLLPLPYNLWRRRQEERGLQKFHSFVLVSNFQKDVAKMRRQISTVKGDAEEIADHW